MCFEIQKVLGSGKMGSAFHFIPSLSVAGGALQSSISMFLQETHGYSHEGGGIKMTSNITSAKVEFCHQMTLLETL